VALRRLIEDRVLLLLDHLRIEQGGYLRAVKPYQGDTDPDGEDVDLNRVLNGQAPACLVTTGDANFETPSVSRRYTTSEVVIDLLVVSNNLRMAEDAARGAPADPGIYQMVEDVHEALFGSSLGLPLVGYPRPTGERAIVRSGTKKVWGVTYSVFVKHRSTRDDDAGWYTRIENKLHLVEADSEDPTLVAHRNLETPEEP
jgi:hypothetical protein